MKSDNIICMGGDGICMWTLLPLAGFRLQMATFYGSKTTFYEINKSLS